MIKKEQLQSIIQKYFLGGLVESTKWTIQDKKLSIKFMAPSSDMLGQLECPNFELENSVFAVYNTTQLNKLLQVTSGELELKLIKNGKIASKINIDDKHFNVTYSLADVMLINKVAEVDEPDTYEIELNLTDEDVQALIKAKNALIDGDNFTIESDMDTHGEPIVLFTFGDDTEYANKVTYSIQTKSESRIGKIPFNSIHLKEILTANKDLENSKIFINSEGLMKLKFSNKEGFNSEYFMIRKPEL